MKGKKKLSSKEKKALESAKEDGIYLYCIVPKEANISLEASGIEGREVYTLSRKDLALVVSDVPMKEYEPTDENVEAHRRVAVSALHDATVLPVAFGMVFKKKKILFNTVRKSYSTIKSSLLAVKDKAELGVKIVTEKNPDSDLDKEELEEEFLEKLQGIAVSTKKGKLFSDRLALNASFLVDKDSISSFSEEVANLEKKHPDLTVKYSGPWPAYNFVDVRIMSKQGGGR